MTSAWLKARDLYVEKLEEGNSALSALATRNAFKVIEGLHSSAHLQDAIIDALRLALKEDGEATAIACQCMFEARFSPYLQ